MERLLPFGRRATTTVVFGLPIIEAATGVLTLIAPAVGLVVSAALLGVFSIAAFVLSFRSDGQPCSCFGALAPSRISKTLAARNALLGGVAVYPAALAIDGAVPPLSPPAILLAFMTLLLVIIASDFRLFRKRASSLVSE